MAIYNIKGKASIWWQDLKISQGLKEKTMEWVEFKRLFKKSTYPRITTKGKPKNSMSKDSAR